jgi:hypothetical protein
MNALTAQELLSVWERGQSQPPFQRALLLLAAACPAAAPESIARWPIGRRDAALLTLRDWTFGRAIESVAACPACGEQLELRFDSDDIRAEPEAADRDGTVALHYGDYDIVARLPNSGDLAALALARPPDPRQALLERCIVQARCAGESDDGALPPEVEAAVIERMAAADPQADVELALTCPACRHDWAAPFDIVGFFWSEIETWAAQMLREIHLIASAYSWRESDILALSPQRRRMYLELIGV